MRASSFSVIRFLMCKAFLCQQNGANDVCGGILPIRAARYAHYILFQLD